MIPSVAVIEDDEASVWALQEMPYLKALHARVVSTTSPLAFFAHIERSNVHAAIIDVFLEFHRLE